MAICNSLKEVPQIGDVITSVRVVTEYEPDHVISLDFASGLNVMYHYWNPDDKEEKKNNATETVYRAMAERDIGRKTSSFSV